MSVETVGAVGNYVEFTVKETLIKAKVTMISADCMQAMCVDTGTKYLFYKTNGVWCLSLQSVSFHKPTQDELNNEKQSYWTKY